MRIGDRVRIVNIDINQCDDDDQYQELFDKYIDKSFIINEIEENKTVTVDLDSKRSETFYHGEYEVEMQSFEL